MMLSIKKSELNTIISNPTLLKDDCNKYYTESNVSHFLEPIRNRWILAAQNRGLLPSFVTKDYIAIQCSILRSSS